MKKLLTISAAVISLMLVGAGCGAASSGGSAAAGGGDSAISAAFKAAGLNATAKDKLAAAKASVSAGDADKIVSFTEFKFEGSSQVLLVGEVADPKDVGFIASYVGEAVKPMAEAGGLVYAGVGSLKDPHWFAFLLAKSDDADRKAVQAISK